MVKMGKGTKERMGVVVQLTNYAFNFGFIPFVLYLGYKKGADPGNPPLSLMNLLWQ